MAVQVFNTSANEYARTHTGLQRRYNSIYENRRDFNQRETPLINAPHAPSRFARFVSTLKNHELLARSRVQTKVERTTIRKLAQQIHPPRTL